MPDRSPAEASIYRLCTALLVGVPHHRAVALLRELASLLVTVGRSDLARVAEDFEAALATVGEPPPPAS